MFIYTTNQKGTTNCECSLEDEGLIELVYVCVGVSMESLGCLQYYSVKIWGTYWENLGEKGWFVEGI